MIGSFLFLFRGSDSSAIDRTAIVADACDRQGIRFVPLDSENCNYLALPEPAPGDMLFNAGRGSARLETLLMRPYVATFRTCGTMVITNDSDTTIYGAALQSAGIPQPRTIQHLPATEQLDAYVSYLGGFPVVLKAVGGSLGVGVMVVEFMRSLRSIADWLRACGEAVIMREFIEAEHVARIVVLGDRVLASLKYAVHHDDFRGLPLTRGAGRMNFGCAIEQLALKATKAVQYEFTGVDIAIHRDGSPFVLEVNPPSNYVALERKQGIAVGDAIVAHLSRKACALASK